MVRLPFGLNSGVRDLSRSREMLLKCSLDSGSGYISDKVTRRVVVRRGSLGSQREQFKRSLANDLEETNILSFYPSNLLRG